MSLFKFILNDYFIIETLCVSKFITPLHYLLWIWHTTSPVVGTTYTYESFLYFNSKSVNSNVFFYNNSTLKDAGLLGSLGPQTDFDHGD